MRECENVRVLYRKNVKIFEGKNMKWFFAAILVLGLTSCGLKKPSVEDLYQADRDFSALSEKAGFAEAFIRYAHDDAVLLRPKRMPVTGKSEIVNLYEKARLSKAVLTWEPLSGGIAGSGDLGYTYGTYLAVAGQDTTRGTYVSIWKKDSAGKWKYVLDTGNEGLQ